MLFYAQAYLCSGVDPVANFHTKNGAIIHGVYFNASQEDNIREQSAGMLCSYRYHPMKYGEELDSSGLPIRKKFLEDIEEECKL